MNLFSFKNFSSLLVVTIPRRARSYKSAGKGAETKMKVFLQRKNPLTGSSEWEVGVDHDEYDYHQEIARSAFADMLHDTERNNMYYRALQLAIKKMHRDGKQANVLDIGTGTGLLSMMAAKCGADTVTACEAFKPMAECCLKILEANGLSDKVKVIPKRSTEMIVGEGGDMEKKANILVTEVFDTELIGEGALLTFSHAHAHLLEAECIVVPDSAVVFAQVVESPFLRRWNTLDDVDATELGVRLNTPQKVAGCCGAAAVHDVQLSQVPRGALRDLSPPLPVLHMDWSGRTPLPLRQLLRRPFSALSSGVPHALLVWWELHMDPEGTIVLSCAPWWRHHAADQSVPRPAETVPWRDHWLQAVYYLPHHPPLVEHQESTLVVCHDEYSLWFEIETAPCPERAPPAPPARPACSCGVHVTWSRTHIAHLNDPQHGRQLWRPLKRALDSHSVVLDLNGSSLLPLLAAKLVNKVYIHETDRFNLNILQDYITCNDITNVEFLPELKEDLLKDVTNVIFDPIYSSSILPWDSLRAACALYRCGGWLGDVSVTPSRFRLWAAPVQFHDLHKIRVPITSCEGFDVTIFDQLVEKSRTVSDAEIEPQPLWEYPARCRGVPQVLLTVHLEHLQPRYTADGTFTLSECNGSDDEPAIPVNGFALWVTWDEGHAQDEGHTGPGGPTRVMKLGETIQWDPHTRQAVKILKEPRVVRRGARWGYRVACDLHAGTCHVDVTIQP